MMHAVRRLWSFVVRHKYAFAVLAVGVGLHFWFVLLHPTTALYGGPGDHTAGLIWLYEQSPQSPWWTVSHATAYPFGDDLWNPAYLLGQAFYISYWLCATLVQDGVGGYNLLTFIYLAISYFVVYGVLTKLVNKDRFALSIVSYVVVFSPFLLFLSGVGHVSYMIAPAWAMLLFYCVYTVLNKDPLSSKRRYFAGAVLLMGLAWLHDPYFVLFSWVLALGVGLGVMISATRSMYVTIIKKFMLICVAAAILMVPVGVYSVIQAHSLKESAYGFRGDIRNDVDLYSARIKDFLLPSAQNPFHLDVVKNYKSSTFHGGDPTFTIYIGWSTIAIVLLGGALTLFRRVYWSEPEKKIILVCLVVIGALLLFSTPTKVHAGNIDIPTLTYVMTEFAGVWRVLARIYIFILPVYLVVVALCLGKITNLLPRRGLRYFTLGVVLMLFVADFMPRNPLDTGRYWHIQNSLPRSYQYIKDSPSVRAIAEYPLREAPHYRGSLYFTAQLYHKKPLLNSTQTVTDQTLLREALMDLDNPQTIRTLRLLGVDTIQVWQNRTQQWSGSVSTVKLSEEGYASMFGKNDRVALFRIREAPIDPAARYVAVLDADSRMLNGEELYDVRQAIPEKFNINIIDICQYEAVKSRCGDAHEAPSLVYEGYMANAHSAGRRLTVQHGQTVNEYTVPANSRIKVIIPLKSAEEEIAMRLDSGEGVSIVGGHVRLESDE